MECLKPESTVLPEIGLALLKFVSSHRGLTYAASARLDKYYSDPFADLRYLTSIQEGST